MFVTVCILMASQYANAKDFGQYGAIFDIQEEDLLTVLENKLYEKQNNVH